MEDYLIHYGVLGMKWGVRRYQNEDGTLTSAGKKRASEGKKQRSSEDIAKRKATAKKVAIGLAATATVATAAYIYAKNKDTVDAFISANVQMAKDANFSRIEGNVKKTAAYVSKNKSKILDSARLTAKYERYLSPNEVNEAIKVFNRRKAIHGLAQNEIRRGSDYINAVMAGVGSAAAIYGVKNQQVVKDVKNEIKKKKDQDSSEK